jgi:hypothetical protein
MKRRNRGRLQSVKCLRIDSFLARLLHQITSIPVVADRPRPAVPKNLGGGTAGRFSELNRRRIVAARLRQHNGPVTP